MEERKDRKGLFRKLADSLGFYKNNASVADHLREADMRSTMYMAGVVAVLELFMLIRYVFRWVLTGKCATAADFFHYTKSYWILLAAALFMLTYAWLYISGRIKKNKQLSWLFTGAFFAVSIYFGIVTGMTDFSKGKMVTAFLTMMLFAIISVTYSLHRLC